MICHIRVIILFGISSGQNLVKKAVGWFVPQKTTKNPVKVSLTTSNASSNRFHSNTLHVSHHSSVAHWLYSGTYFNCIMFMVASSVVTTIMILNYHHRLADTHEMPSWVSDQSGGVGILYI